MAPSKSSDPKDIVKGGILQCVEAATLGLPFEVWKTHMGTFRQQGTMEAFSNLYKKNGIAAFYKGWEPKMVECFLKGGILLFSKEAIIRNLRSAHVDEVSAGLIGGFGGGVAQVTIMGPCTYLVTAAVAGDGKTPLMKQISTTWTQQGIKGFYSGGVALILRQGSNWASRQGFTDWVRSLLKSSKAGSGDTSNVKLTVLEEAFAGTIGGMLSTWNQPFEVLRIEAQANAAKGLPPKSIVQTAALIIRENGPAGLFQGLLPRMGLCVWQTLFMVTIPYILKPYGF